MPTYNEQGINAEALTPNDSVNISIGGQEIDNSLTQGVCPFIGTGGDLTVTMLGGQVVTFKNIPDGTFLPIQIKKLWTSTTATDIIGVY